MGVATMWEAFRVSANEWPGIQFGRFSAHRGRWISEDTYQLDLHFVDDVENTQLTATFDGEELQLTAVDLMTNWANIIQGSQQGM